MTTAASLGFSPVELDRRGAQNTVKEIAQQPALWRAVASAAALRCPERQAFLAPLLERGDLRIILTGAGTSAFAGAILAPALTGRLRRRVDAIPTTDIVSNPGECFAENQATLLVSFARSGDSPESVAATHIAEQCLTEVHHLVLTCNRDGELYRQHAAGDRSMVLLMPAQANDQGFAMTSSFTCMVLATWLALGAAPTDNTLTGRLALAGEQVLATFGDAARRVVQRGYERIIFLGSGPLTGLARESALKLLELTAGGVVTYFDSPMGFRHGPKAVLDKSTLAVIYLSNDSYTRQYDIDMMNELCRALGAENVLAIGGGDLDGPRRRDFWRIEGIDTVEDAVLSLPYAICAQLLALHFSLGLGRRPDNPFPAGQVNRVVQGVTIHPYAR